MPVVWRGLAQWGECVSAVLYRQGNIFYLLLICMGLASLLLDRPELKKKQYAREATAAHILGWTQIVLGGLLWLGARLFTYFF